MKRQLATSALDVVTGAIATGLVILATDATGVDFRVQFLASSSLFFLLGLWRAQVAGLPAWSRVLLIVSVPTVLALVSVVKYWPPPWPVIAYSTLFPVLQCAAAAIAFWLARRAPLSLRRATVLLGAVAAASVVVGWSTMPAFSRSLSFDSAVRLAPTTQFETFAGERVSSADWQGKVVVLNFWASWCAPCVAELVELEEIYQEYSGKGDSVVFWAVNTRDERTSAEAFIAEHDYSLPFAIDPGNAAYETLAPASFPAIFLIDKLGRVRLTHIGYSRSEGLSEHLGAQIAKLMAEET